MSCISLYALTTTVLWTKTDWLLQLLRCIYISFSCDFSLTSLVRILVMCVSVEYLWNQSITINLKTWSATSNENRFWINLKYTLPNKQTNKKRTVSQNLRREITDIPVDSQFQSFQADAIAYFLRNRLYSIVTEKQLLEAS